MSDPCTCARTIASEANDLAQTGVPAEDIAPLLLALACEAEDLYRALEVHLHGVGALGAADRAAVRAGHGISLALDALKGQPSRGRVFARL